MILAAEAEREKQIREAEGEAAAILNVQQATADGIRMVREAGADNAVLTLQAFEALKTVADGQATKIIIPSDIQGVAGLAASLKEIVEMCIRDSFTTALFSVWVTVHVA